MFSISDDFRKPMLNIGLASQWNPRTVGNLPDLMRETDAGVAVDLALSLLGFELQGGFLYLRTSRDTLSGVPDLERMGFWGHLRYTIPRLPLQITPGYRISSYARARASAPPRQRDGRALRCQLHAALSHARCASASDANLPAARLAGLHLHWRARAERPQQRPLEVDVVLVF